MFPSVVTVNFTNQSYMVREDSGSLPVTVQANGILGRGNEVKFQLTSEPSGLPNEAVGEIPNRNW